MAIVSGGGGGGSGLPTGWTQSGSPADVNTHGGSVDGAGALNTAVGGQVNTDNLTSLQAAVATAGFFQLNGAPGGGATVYASAPTNTAATNALEVADFSFNDVFLIRGDGAMVHLGTLAGFFGTAPIAKPTGVAVSAAGVHAALVSLGLIAA